MRKLLSYAKSHIYEIHAIFAATVVVGLMYLIKRPIKRWTVKIVDEKIEKAPELFRQRENMIKRRNMILIVLTMCLAVVVFALLSVVSPLIEFSFPMAVLTGVFALCEYAFIEQITFGVSK